MRSIALEKIGLRFVIRDVYASPSTKPSTRYYLLRNYCQADETFLQVIKNIEGDNETAQKDSNERADASNRISFLFEAFSFVTTPGEPVDLHFKFTVCKTGL